MVGSSFPILWSRARSLRASFCLAHSASRKSASSACVLRSSATVSRRIFPRLFPRCICPTIPIPFANCRTAARFFGNAWIFYSFSLPATREELADAALKWLINDGKFTYAQLDQIQHLNARVKLSLALTLAKEKGTTINFRALSHPRAGREDKKGCRLYNNLFALVKTFVENSAARPSPMTAAH
jgi:hypothetical protein